MENNLTPYEKKEICKYEEKGIFYTGANAKKICATESDIESFCFDDEVGYYRTVVRDHLGYRFEICRVIRRGTFGVAVEATDHKEKKQVAIKIARAGEEFYEKCVEEINMLKHINEADLDRSQYLVKMFGDFSFRNHNCIVFENLSSDLYEELKKSNFKGLEINRVRRITKCILRGLATLHRLNIVHGDLKPSNIVLVRDGSSRAKIIDFGNSFVDQGEVTAYIQTRYYRAPEVLYHLKCNKSVDMWSVGCIVFELLKGQTLFRGSAERFQLMKMYEVLGYPPVEHALEWRTISDYGKLYFQKTGEPILFGTCSSLDDFATEIDLNRWHPSSAPFSQTMEGCPVPAIKEFIESCCTWLAEDRLTPIDGLQHRWILHKTIPSIDTYPVVAFQMGQTYKVNPSLSDPTIFRRKFPDYVMPTNVKTEEVPNPAVKKTQSETHANDHLLFAYSKTVIRMSKETSEQ